MLSSTPTHPPLTSCVASNMCASARNVIIPTPPPTPDQLRSIQHVCKCKECYHPPPTHPDQLRSIQHVCKCKECYHPPPPPTPDQLRSIQHVCKCKECYHPPPHPPLTSCVASNMCAKWGEMSKCAQKPTAFCEPWANYLVTGMILQVGTMISLVFIDRAGLLSLLLSSPSSDVEKSKNPCCVCFSPVN